ncbi:putative xyloglucan endotransglucosylase/hydrolase protein 27 [Wolffia australiana]
MGMAGGVFFVCLLLCCCVSLISSSSSSSSSFSSSSSLDDEFDSEEDDYQSPAFEESYTQLFGDHNLKLLRDGKTVHIALDKRTGAGFVSQELYLHGHFSASIKLPSDYTAGVVVAFYLSNGDVYEKTHDELDFEFLGNVRGRQWRIQTNVYGNGSTATGREERYHLWFDPTADFHRYSILWTDHKILFFVDGVPIREILKSAAMESFPGKAMSVYATIWDGSTWATSGGRFRVDYRRGPYVAQFADLVLRGCPVSSPACHGGGRRRLPGDLTAAQRRAMAAVRSKHMTYSYCYDRERYPAAPPECGGGGGGGAGLARRRRGARRRRAAVDGLFSAV